MSARTTEFLLTLLGTLLLILTLVCVLLVPIYVGFNAVSARAGEVHAARLALGSLGFLALAAACGGGAWFIRRLMKRREMAARQRRASGGA
jgi:hypothetical protein